MFRQLMYMYYFRDAGDAIKELDDKDFLGSVIKVEWPRSTGRRGGRDGGRGGGRDGGRGGDRDGGRGGGRR